MKMNEEQEMQSALMLLTLLKCESITKDHQNNSAIVKPLMHITIKGGRAAGALDLDVGIGNAGRRQDLVLKLASLQTNGSAPNYSV